MKKNSKATVILCPKCGSKRTNKVSPKNSFCLACDVEFTKTGEVFTILYDGDLVDYFLNEFSDCG